MSVASTEPISYILERNIKQNDSTRMKELKCIWDKKTKPFKDTGRILAHPLWKLARHPEAWLYGMI